MQLHMFGSAQRCVYPFSHACVCGYLSLPSYLLCPFIALCSLFAIRGTCDIDLCYVAEGPGVKEKRVCFLRSMH